MKKFIYYEEGSVRFFTFAEVAQLYIAVVDSEQKYNGTTFLSWLFEMEKLQILNRL